MEDLIIFMYNDLTSVFVFTDNSIFNILRDIHSFDRIQFTSEIVALKDIIRIQFWHYNSKNMWISLSGYSAFRIYIYVVYTCRGSKVRYVLEFHGHWNI